MHTQLRVLRVAFAMLRVGSGLGAGGGQSQAATPRSASSPSVTSTAATSPSAAPSSNARTSLAAILSISGSSTTLTFKLTYQGTPSFVRVYVDSDRKATTGYPTGGIGTDYLIENQYLYRYAGSGGSWPGH